MAITKERLQELINEGATIYYKGGYSIDLSKTDSFMENIFEFYYMIEDNRLLKMQKQPHIALNQWWIKDLYETQKQSEWHLKYHATRTEELNLPTWEEIEKIKEKGVYIIARPREMMFYIDYKFLIPQIKLCTLEDVFNWNLDEEGYLSACDLCVKLFKGEEEC